MYIKRDADGYIVETSSEPIEGGEGDQVELPSAFDYDNADCYQYLNGKILLDTEKLAIKLRSRYLLLDKDGYVLCTNTTPIEGGTEELVELPQEYIDSPNDCYRYIDGTVVFDAGKYQRQEEDEQRRSEENTRKAQLTQDSIEVGRLMFVMAAQSGQIDESTISKHPIQFPEWAKSRWGEMKQGTIWNHNGSLWRFNLATLNDESQNLEPGTSETLWTLINYKSGVKVIPYPRRALKTEEAFTASELGWWEGDEQAKRGVWQAPAAGAVWPPATVGVNWTFVRDEP